MFSEEIKIKKGIKNYKTSKCECPYCSAAKWICDSTLQCGKALKQRKLMPY